MIFCMSTLAEIEEAMNALPFSEKKELLRRLKERLEPDRKPKRRLPLVPKTGRPISQEEIDNAWDAD
jgi:hypothetical protein